MVWGRVGRAAPAVVKRCMSNLPQESGTYAKEFAIADGLSLGMQVTVTRKGLLVASIENYAPMSRIVLAVNSGSRFETAAEQGAGHCLRALAFLSTKDATHFGIGRNVDVNGGLAHATSTRESTCYGVDVVRDKLPLAIDILDQIGTKQAFKPWEVAEGLEHSLKQEMDMVAAEPHKLAVELAHKAAYRKGLGRSIYAPAHALKTLNSDILQDFVAETFVTSRMAVLGVGVNHEELVELCSKLRGQKGEGRSTAPSKFLGGQEIRNDDASPFANVGLVYEGASLNSKDVLALGVLQRIVGAGPSIKYGVGNGRLSKAVATSIKNPALAGCINANYSDSGVFGVQLTARAADAGDVIKVAVGVLKDLAGGNVSDAEIQSGKNQLKASLFMAAENGGAVLEDLAVQTLFQRQIIDLATVAEAIDAVSAADVKGVASRVLSSAPSMGALGGLATVPYLDEL